MTDHPGDALPPETWDALVQEANRIRTRAHAPYSNFQVGAALLTESGEIISGCNVEIASIGATTCAERNAIAAAVARGEKTFKALAVSTVNAPSAPCGICRQVLAEFCDALPILLTNPEGDRVFTTLDELLPMRFSGRDFLED